MRNKHWSKVQNLAETVKNPNIVIKGRHSYYSDAWSGSFEDYCVRYLYGDEYSLAHWEPQWKTDKLYLKEYLAEHNITDILFLQEAEQQMFDLYNHNISDTVVR